MMFIFCFSVFLTIFVLYGNFLFPFIVNMHFAVLVDSFIYINVCCITKYELKFSQIHLESFHRHAAKATCDICVWDHCKQKKMNNPIVLDKKVRLRETDGFHEGDNFCFFFNVWA